MSLLFDTVSNDRDVEQILSLQASNHRSAVDPVTAASDGFTTVRHDPQVLLEMNRQYPSAIARSGSTLAGYCLMMPQSFRQRVPILEPMFALLEGLHWSSAALAQNPRWFVMGQVCVAAEFRGMGVFDGMYHKLREVYSGDFDLTITEVSQRNQRSLRAHQRVGFQTMHVYDDAIADDRWEVMVWDWR